MTGEEKEEEEKERKKRRRKPEKSPARSGEISFGSEAAGCQLLTVNVCLVLRGGAVGRDEWGGGGARREEKCRFEPLKFSRRR